jgi:hypothetical protein
VILEGSVLLTSAGQAPLELKENDFILVPAASGFAMSSIDGGGTVPGRPSAATTRDGKTGHGDPDGPTDVRMLAGRLAFGSPDAGLLTSLLPALLHVRGLKRMATLVQLVRNEAQDDRPARETVLARLLEVLLIEALRSIPFGGWDRMVLPALPSARRSPFS